MQQQDHAPPAGHAAVLDICTVLTDTATLAQNKGWRTCHYPMLTFNVSYAIAALSLEPILLQAGAECSNRAMHHLQAMLAFLIIM